MDKILAGSLDSFEVPDLLSLLNTGGRTGVLVFERPDRETKIFLREGRPVFATSSAISIGSTVFPAETRRPS